MKLCYSTFRNLYPESFVSVSIYVQWDSIEPDTLYFTIHNSWTWAELEQQIDAAVELAVRAVPVIVDLREWTGLPCSNLFLPDNLKPAKALIARNVLRQSPVVVVGADADARMLYDCLRMMDAHIGWQVYFTDTPDAARDFLRGEHSKRPA